MNAWGERESREVEEGRILRRAENVLLKGTRGIIAADFLIGAVGFVAFEAGGWVMRIT